jgi:hypothetical protein
MKLKITLLALLTLGACSKEKGEEAAPGEAPTAAKSGDKADKAAAAPAGPMKLEKLGGISIDVPAGTALSEMGKSQMLQGPDLVVTVEEAGQFAAETLAAELEEAKDMYSATEVTQEEVEGGWHVTFQNKGGMGTNYWVKSRVTIGGKAYTCGTTGSSAKQQANALAACKSLK